MSAFLLTDAIHSVAASHPSQCGCDTCLAASGDPEAFGRTLASVQRQMIKRQGRDLDDLTPRQQMILDRIESGDAECGLCADFGAIVEGTGERVECLACGRKNPKTGLMP